MQRTKHIKKTCSKCKQEFDISFFYKNKNNKDGYANQCQLCFKDYIDINREQMLETGKIWYSNNITKVKKRREDHYQRNRDIYIRYHLKSKFNMHVEEYYEMLENQNCCCAICERHESEFTKILYIDHDHTTGKVRGLLCGNCNSFLGHAHDDIKILYKAIKYLKKFNLNN